MILYPIISTIAFSTWNIFSGPKSWIKVVTRDQRWRSQAPLKGKVLWMHCASLGEFEMGRPAFERFLDAHPEWKGVVTFFSPSGYEPRKSYSRAQVFYLPLDTPRNAQKWLEFCNPSLAIFVRYDLWPNHIQALRKSAVPTVVIAFSAPKRPWFFSPFLPLLRAVFEKGISFWGTVNEDDSAQLSYLGIHSEVLGNPKYDYACRTIGANIPEHLIAWKNMQEKPILIIGSAHQGDVVWASRIQESQQFSIWIVPHKLEESSDLTHHFEWTGKFIPKSSADVPVNTDVLLVDEFGVLAGLYAVADAVIIGGGFGKATHNALEVIAQAKIPASGPNWQKIPENHDLIRQGFLVSGQRPEELQSYLKRVLDGALNSKGEEAQQWLLKQKGATEKIVDVLEQSVQL